jgi:hypothetical protein
MSFACLQISYNDLAYLCAEVAGIDKSQVKLEHYNSGEYLERRACWHRKKTGLLTLDANLDTDLLGKGTFPFRPTNFYVAPTKAKELLQWEGPRHSLRNDLLTFYYDQYLARGGPEKKISLVKDWEIVVGCKTPPAAYVSSIYEKYDPLVLEKM